MYYLLFTFYLFIAVYLINRISFTRQSGLSPKIITGLFLLKIFAGIALGWITQKTYPGNDYWGLNTDGLAEYKLMISDPREFFINIFRSPYQHGYTGFFESIGSYWNDLRYNIILKVLAFCDIFSRGSFYINSLIFNFFGFFGPLALFRVFSDIYKNRKWAIICGCFLLPSTLYFSSGIHKDLIVFTLLGFYCYGLFFSVMQKFTFKRSILIFLSFAVILFIRNYVAIALVPVSFAFIICVKKRITPLAFFTATYAGILFILLLLQLVVPAFQPLKIITQKQKDFFNIPVAATQLNTNILEPDLKSFIWNSPQAIDHGFLRPYIWDKGILLIPLAVELFVYEGLFLFILFSGRLKIKSIHPFILFAVFFAVSILLITGFIIPNTGSIVRYKSIYLPFLLTPLLSSFYIKKKI